MARLDLFHKFRREKPEDRYAARDALLVEMAQTDGYKALLDFYERELLVAVESTLFAKTEDERREAAATGRAILSLIQGIDRKCRVFAQEEEKRAILERALVARKESSEELEVLERKLYATQMTSMSDVRHRAPAVDLDGAY